MATTDQPADTRMMGIVHDALKRDLGRTRNVLTAEPAPRGRQRVAVAQYVVWMLDFLHSHHTAEDNGLWPLVRRRNPAAGELLDSLEADHARIAPAAATTAAAAHLYASASADPADTQRLALVDALDDLTVVLVPHLDREVAEAMPVVAASISEREWDAVEQQHNIRPKSTRQLAMEGHWLLEGIDPEGYEVVVHKVPMVLRLVLLHGFGRSYRRLAEASWTADAAARTSVAG